MRDETRTARHRPTTEAIAIREAFPTITILFVHQKNNKNALVNEAKSLPKCFGDPELGRGLLSSDTLPPPLSRVGRRQPFPTVSEGFCISIFNASIRCSCTGSNY